MREGITEGKGDSMHGLREGGVKSHGSQGPSAHPLGEIVRLNQKLEALDLQQVKSDMMFLMEKLTESGDGKNIIELKKLMDAFGTMAVNLYGLSDFIERNFTDTSKIQGNLE